MTAMMTPEHFTRLLDTHGSRLAAWPAHDRAGAQALLARSAGARAQLAAAERLDALLHEVPAHEPSAALAERVLAAAPRVRRGRRAVLAAAAGGLALAASLALWLVRAPAPGRSPSLDANALAQLGVLEVPTDALLSGGYLELDDDAPVFGCDDPSLGCDEPTLVPERSGRGTVAKEMPA
jgi:hypothetical protein